MIWVALAVVLVLDVKFRIAGQLTSTLPQLALAATISIGLVAKVSGASSFFPPPRSAIPGLANKTILLFLAPDLVWTVLFALLRSDEPQQGINSTPLGPALATLLLSTIVVASWEEVVFRRILLSVLSQALMPWQAVLTGSAIFALAHIPTTFGQAIALFTTGIVLGFVYVRTGSLVAVVLMHAMNNLAVALINCSLDICNAIAPVNSQSTALLKGVWVLGKCASIIYILVLIARTPRSHDSIAGK